jgi:hypothetical protein
MVGMMGCPLLQALQLLRQSSVLGPPHAEHLAGAVGFRTLSGELATIEPALDFCVPHWLELLFENVHHPTEECFVRARKPERRCYLHKIFPANARPSDADSSWPRSRWLPRWRSAHTVFNGLSIRVTKSIQSCPLRAIPQKMLAVLVGGADRPAVAVYGSSALPFTETESSCPVLFSTVFRYPSRYAASCFSASTSRLKAFMSMT